MLKVGRYTTALLFITVGILVLASQSTGTNYIRYLLDWWPVVLISLGVEYLIFNFLNRNNEKKLRLDLGGLFLAALVSAIVIGTTQTSFQPYKWANALRTYIAPFTVSYSTESGNKFEKGVTKIPLESGTAKIILENPNGSLQLKAGATQDIEVNTTVWIDNLENDEAAKIAGQSTIEYSGGSTLKITAKGEEYSGSFTNKRKPRMNLVVTVPSDRKTDFDLQLRNGNIQAAQLAVVNDLKARTVNGSITVTDINGNVFADTINGPLEAAGISGAASLNTTNGTVTAVRIGKNVNIDTTNGSVTVDQAGGDVDANTTNGKITVREAARNIKADTVNNQVSVYSSAVGGDYDLRTMHGDILVNIPSNADIEVKGTTSLGAIRTNLPFTVENKKISGKLGSGKYYLKIRTNNDIQVNNID